LHKICLFSGAHAIGFFVQFHGLYPVFISAPLLFFLYWVPYSKHYDAVHNMKAII